MNKLEDIIATMRDMDNELRLEFLLEYSETLPPVPDELLEEADLESRRVHECQTPVSLWVQVIDGKVQIYADVPRESPTVRGFISLLIHAFNGAPPDEVLAAPMDILQRSGLAQTLGMMRMQGLSAIYRRIKQEVLQGLVSPTTEE